MNQRITNFVKAWNKKFGTHYRTASVADGVEKAIECYGEEEVFEYLDKIYEQSFTKDIKAVASWANIETGIYRGFYEIYDSVCERTIRMPLSGMKSLRF